ncbi:MAG: hypothetical protein WDW38_010385 [Sanguina aurantia]
MALSGMKTRAPSVASQKARVPSVARVLPARARSSVAVQAANPKKGEELEPARAKAEKMGVKQIFIEDLREEFVRDYVFPMFRANALYEGTYLLGTSIARPLIAKRQIEIAQMVGADAVSHGATGKGNDQVRFEVGYYSLKPDIRVIAPWREWDLLSRTKLIEYAEKNSIPVPASKRGEPPFSMDANLLHISYEGNALEDPWMAPIEGMFTRSVSPEQAPDVATFVEVEFEKGNPVAIDGVKMSPATLLTKLNEMGGKNGIGRVDLVESRFVGMKSRGRPDPPPHLTPFKLPETPGLPVCAQDDLTPRYAEMVYNGFWFSPEREALQVLVDKTQEYCTGSPGDSRGYTTRRGWVGVVTWTCAPTGSRGSHPSDDVVSPGRRRHSAAWVTRTLGLGRGPVSATLIPARRASGDARRRRSSADVTRTRAGLCRGPVSATLMPARRASADARRPGTPLCVVRLKLYKGNVMVQGRKSPYSLYDPVVASFEDDKGLYNQADAGGFIKLQALRLRTLAVNRHKML